MPLPPPPPRRAVLWGICLMFFPNRHLSGVDGKSTLTVVYLSISGIYPQN